MAESTLGPAPSSGSGMESPEALLKEGARAAGEALGALEEAVVRERRAVATLSEELPRCARDLQYERKWRGRDQLLNLANFLGARAKAAEGGLSTLLEQVAACQRLAGKHAELMEALYRLETELAPYAQATTAADSAFDPTTPYGAFVPALRLFTSEMGAAGRELGGRPVPEDFVEASMFRKYQAALGRLAPMVQALAPPPYVDLHGRVSTARESLMQGIVLVRSRADRDAAVLKNVEQVKADLTSDFERVEILFAELEAAKTGEVRFPGSPAQEPEPPSADGEPRRKSLFGRLRK